MFPQMYKVYRDPEGKSVMEAPQTMATNYTFQCSEEAYKEQIEKLKKENLNLKDKVSVCMYVCILFIGAQFV